MKRLSIISAASLMFIFFAFGGGAFAAEDSEGWTSLSKDIYINVRSMAYSRGNAISLWVKIVPDEDSNVLMAARELFMNKGRDDKALAYSYSGLLTEIDCSKNNHRELMTILYDINKNIIHSADHPKAPWETISPGSGLDIVQKAVCDKSLPYAATKNAGVRSGC
ncbi:MAG: surface-adhesin E family protein [Thermodesulfovibrionales bacterium]